ncbi:MAG: M20/M25/M40 family metallo-hydrolase [Caldilineaceae bacterium]|nr:M20/M25/M40 family metallo-hydrolase [Caldilineaceae bacterium]
MAEKDSCADGDPAELTQVLAYVEDHRQAFVERLLAYVARPSISAHGVGIEETAEFLLGYLQGLGMESQLLAGGGWPFVYGRNCRSPGAPTVLLYGHYDVQPPDPLEAWESPPFEPEIRDGRIWGRGVGDNKGQHLAQLLAIESWLAVIGGLPCNVIVLLEGEEEIGSPHISDCVRVHRDLLADADLVITADGPVHESGRPCIKFGPRGIASFELRVRHAERDFHSGNWGGVAPNPIWTLVHLLATMKNSRGEVIIDGFYDNVAPLGELERAALDALPVDTAAVMAGAGLARLDEPQERPFFDRLAAWPTFTINGFHGGYGGPGTKTVLPREATVKCDMRLVENQSVEEILDKVEAHVRCHAPEVEVIRQGGMEPSSTPLDSPYTLPLQKAFRAAQGEDPLLIPAMGGSLPDYAWTKILGVPSFTTPYANHDEANHAPNENLEVERFIAGIRTGAAVLAYLGTHS